MIQRIQTIYLFLAATCGFSILGLPFAATPAGVQSSTLFADANFSANDNIGMMVLFAVAGILALGSIFLFNNRQTQIKLGWLALIANIVGALYTGYLYWEDSPQIAGQPVAPGVSAFLPIGFILFAFLAINGIKKDEALVKSADRLR